VHKKLQEWLIDISWQRGSEITNVYLFLISPVSGFEIPSWQLFNCFLTVSPRQHIKPYLDVFSFSSTGSSLNFSIGPLSVSSSSINVVLIPFWNSEREKERAHE
jgi:hypothetical protein